MESMKKPAIRFKGFTEDWEQRKVGDYLIESRIKGNTGRDARKLTVKLWGKGVVEKNDFGGSEHTQYYVRRKGQFIYSKLDFLNSAFGVIPKNLDNYESTADLPAFDLNGMNPYFMFFTAIQKSFYFKYGSIADGSRKAKRIHANTFLDMPVMVPTMEEQTLIVECLQSLDHLITLHQRKYEKLQNMKKACLEKMFPKNGSNVPEIRFKGFTEAWEQRKVSDIAPLQRGFDLSTTNMKAGKYPVVMSNGIGGYHSKYKAKGPGVVTGRSGTIGRLHYIKDDYWPHNTALWVTSFKGNHPKFVYYLYQQLGLERFGSGSGVPTLNRNDVHDAIVPVPHAEEQAQIAACFSQLDHLITLHQRELEKLQNIKKSMLEKMFVSEKKEK